MSRKLAAIYLSRLFGALGFQIFSLYATLRAFALSPKLMTLGTLGLCTFASVAVFSFLSGSLVDRLIEKGRYAFGLHALMVALAVISVILPPASISILFVFAFLFGALRVMRSPVYFVLAKHFLKSSAEPARAKRLFVMSWQLAGVIGPLAGGLIALHFGLHAIQFLYLGLFSVALITLIPALSVRGEAAAPTPFALRASISFFIKDRVLRQTFVLDTLGVLFAGVSALLPFLLSQNHLSPDYLGVLRAIQNGGALITALFLPRILQTGRAFLISVGSFAVLTTLLPLAHSLIAFGLLFLALGLLDGVSILIRDLLLFEKAVPALQGRIYALNSIFISSSDDLGEMESGFVAQAIGVPATAVIGGVLCASLALYFSIRSKDLWNFQFST